MKEFEIIEAEKVTTVTLVGYLKENFPLKKGNCFSVLSGKDHYRIVNFSYENLKELEKRNVITFPIKISPLSRGVAIVADERIPTNWYDSKYCEVCCPKAFLPEPQLLRIFLEIQSGKREEREIEIDGKKMTMVTIKI